MNNINFINLKPYPVDINGKREYVEVIPTFQLQIETLDYTGLDCSRDTPSNNGLDAREANETAFIILEDKEEDSKENGYKTPTKIDYTFSQCPKRKSSREHLQYMK